MNIPSQTVGQYPIQDMGVTFPPVCLRSHWDNTAMLKKFILPGQKVHLPLDPRPLVKICKEYVSSGSVDAYAPEPPSTMVFPMGGSFYPPSRYAEAIDKESALRVLDHPLNRWCDTHDYVVPTSSSMYHPGSTLPDRQPISNGFISELAMPKALLRKDMNTCRTDNDMAYMERSSRVFNNPTKQDRYGAEKYYSLPGGLPKGEPMPHGGVPRVRPTQQHIDARGPRITPILRPPLPKSDPIGIPTQYETSFVGISTTGNTAPVW